jgi:hypothetical protein
MSDFAASVAKTVMGIVPSFDQIFTGVRYVPQLCSGTMRGTAYGYGKGEIYLGTDYHARDLLPDSVPPGRSLACTPVAEMPRFSPQITRGQSYSNSVGPSCLRIVAWRNVGHFLVLAGDPNSVSDVWLAFVPIDQRFEVQS